MPRLTALSALVTLAFTLTACASGPIAPSASEATIGGTIENWPGGTSTVRYNDRFTNPQGIDVSVPITADGHFSLTLPTPAAALLATIPTSDPACPLVGGTPSTLRLYFSTESLQVEVQGTSRQLLELPQDVTIPENGHPNDTVLRMYTDAPGTAHFTLNCSGYVTTYDLNLHTGWNRVEAFVDPATFAVTYRSIPASLTTKLALFIPPMIPPAPTPSPSPMFP